MSLTKLQHLHSAQEQLCEPSCLIDGDHGGRCHTPDPKAVGDAARDFAKLMTGGKMVSCLYPDRCPNGPIEHSRQEGCVRMRIVIAPEAMLAGMSPDASTVTHENGAKESHAPHAFTSIDGMALHRVAQIQHQGDQKYGVDNWRGISEDDHLNHALAHVFAHLAGDRSDDHIGHAAVRMLFALAIHIRPGYAGRDAYRVEPPA